MQTAVQENKIQTKSNTKPFVAPTPIIQKKIEIGAADDSYEAEADLIADLVVARKEVAVPPTPPTNKGSLIQRKCTHCEEEERIQKKPLAQFITPLVQRASTSSDEASLASSEVTNKINASRGGGSLMQNHTRSFMENSFGTDFSQVRIHTDSNAVQLNQKLHAQAFTVGNDIYFNEGKYQPDSNTGKHLLAHELTHTVQQGSASKALNKKSTGNLIQRNILGDIGRGIGRGVSGAASWTWDHTGGAVIHYGGKAIRWVADKAEEIIDEIAPGLLNFLRNGWQSLKDSLAEALDRMTGGLFSQLQAEGLSGVLGEFVDNIVDSLNGKIESACKAFAMLARKIFNFIEGLTGRALDRIRAIFTKISDGLSFLWNEVGKPAIDAVKSIASDVWNWVTEKAQWVWDLLEPIRNAISRAWNWIKRQFNIAWDNANSVLDWLSDKLSEAWNWVKSIIEPIKTPLMIIGGILLLLSPLGPFVAIAAAAYGLYRAVIWVKENWDDEVFIKFREFLKQNILDPIKEGIDKLKEMVSNALAWLNDAFDRLTAAVTSLMDALGELAIFRLISRGLSRFGQMINRAANKVKEGISRVLTFFGEVFAAIWKELRPYAIFLGKLIIVALNPWAIPIILGAWFWRALPDCYKPPVIDFVLRMMILVLGAMPNFRNFGSTWFQIKSQVLQFLNETLGKSDEEKVTIVNNVAIKISELDLEFLSTMVEAVFLMPSEFEGQMEEEMLGMDLTKPLPFELTQEPNLERQFQSLELADAVSAEDARLFSMEHFSENDIAVDEIGQFDPSDELFANILSRISGEEGTIEFGTPPDEQSRSVQALLSEIVQQNGRSEIGSGGLNLTSEAGDEAMSREEEIEFRLQQMMSQSEESMATQACNASAERAPEGEASSGFPEHAKFGPLTRGQRASYTMGQMWSGMRMWWRCNRSWLIPTLLGVLIALVVAEFATGGAVTAALPVIFQALIPIMIGVAAIRSTIYLGEYLRNSIAGEKVLAAKSLARSLAVVAVEVIFALLGALLFGDLSAKAFMGQEMLPLGQDALFSDPLRD